MKTRTGFAVLLSLICAASLLLFPSTVSADDDVDLKYGNGLYSALSRCPVSAAAPYGKENGSDEDFHECIQATSYIRGVVDTLTAYRPAFVTYGQEWEIVAAYLKNHVNQRQRRSVDIIREAIVKAFPPPKGK